MDLESFNKLLHATLESVKELERKKQAEYVPAGELDRLAHFKEIGLITGEPAHQALRGMMVKHTKSIYDMLKDADTTTYTQDKWGEKITDHIIYLILLNAIVTENASHVKNLRRAEDFCDPKNYSPKRDYKFSELDNPAKY